MKSISDHHAGIVLAGAEADGTMDCALVWNYYFHKQQKLFVMYTFRVHLIALNNFAGLYNCSPTTKAVLDAGVKLNSRLTRNRLSKVLVKIEDDKQKGANEFDEIRRRIIFYEIT